MTVTGHYAAFAATLDPARLDDTARARATRYMIDAIGCMLAGAESVEAQVLLRAAKVGAGEGTAVVLGTGLMLDPAWAAMINGTAGHAYDYDDSSPPMIGHPSVALVAAMLASVGQRRVSGLELIGGYVAGLDLSAGLGRRMNPTHYAAGWHATCTLGTLGSTIAAGRITGLTEAQFRWAIGIAASSSSGIRKNFGSMVKPLHAGFAARNAVVAALLAGSGFESDPAALDGSNGFIDVFGGNAESAPFEPSGALEINLSGVGLKRYPCCGCTHTALDVLLSLRAENGIDASKVAAIHCTMNALVPDILVHHRPTTPAQAKFSMEYCLAVALIDGDCGLAQFDPERVVRGDVQDLLRRVTTSVDEGIIYRNGVYPGEVRITMADGTVHVAAGEEAAGHPDHPLSTDDLHLKFVACATRAIARSQAESLFDALIHLEAAPDITRILNLTTKAGNTL